MEKILLAGAQKSNVQDSLNLTLCDSWSHHDHLSTATEIQEISGKRLRLCQGLFKSVQCASGFANVDMAWWEYAQLWSIIYIYIYMCVHVVTHHKNQWLDFYLKILPPNPTSPSAEVKTPIPASKPVAKQPHVSSIFQHGFTVASVASSQLEGSWHCFFSDPICESGRRCDIRWR